MERILELGRGVGIICMLMLSLCSFQVRADDTPSAILVSPSTLIVGGGESFQIGIYCTPGQPVKAFEFDIDFDASLLQATTVSEGSLFLGHETFFNNGTIDNFNGEINTIYNLIVGNGNVTDPGYLVNISFTAASTSGTAQITLSNCGLTNETMYLPITFTNGSVTVDASTPTCIDQSPESGFTGDPFTVNVSVSDNIDDSSDIIAMLEWSHGSAGENVSMNFMGGSYFEKTITLDSGSIDDLTYTIYLQDNQCNSMTTSLISVSVLDNDDPVMLNDGMSGSATTADMITWYLNASDNIDNEVDLSVRIHWTHGSFDENVSMAYTGSYWRYQAVLDDSTDPMTYSFYVLDTAGNHRSTSGSQSPVSVIDNDDPVISDLSASPATQSISGSVNLTAQISDNIELSTVHVNISNPDGSSMNISVLSNQIGSTFFYEDTYNLLGSYEYFFWAQDSAGNIKKSGIQTFLISDSEQPQITDVMLTQSDPIDTEIGFGWTNFSCRVIDDELNLVKLHLIKPDTSVSNISMNSGLNGFYYYNTTLNDLGNYLWHFWVNDTSTNQNRTIPASISIAPNWDVNEDGSVTVFDLTLISNHYNESGNPGWIREDVDNNGVIEVLDIVLSANQYSESWQV